jgi:hypothetical protein
VNPVDDHQNCQVNPIRLHPRLWGYQYKVFFPTQKTKFWVKSMDFSEI